MANRHEQKTIREFEYRGYKVEVKQNGECFTKCCRLKHDIWGESEEAIRENIDRNIRGNSLIDRWDKEDKIAN